MWLDAWGVTMTGEMRQGLNAVKTDVGALKMDVGVLKMDVSALKTDVSVLKTDVGVLKTDVGVLKTDVSVLKTDVNALKMDVSVLKTDVNTLKTDVGVLKTDVSALKTITRNIAVTVAGHTGTFIRMEKQLAKLDELDGLKSSLEVFTSEIIASRHARTLTDKSFSDQQATLTDHELRLTRIELRGKQS